MITIQIYKECSTPTHSKKGENAKNIEKRGIVDNPIGNLVASLWLPYFK